MKPLTREMPITSPVLPKVVGPAKRAAATWLAAAGVPTPELDAEVLLRHLLGVDRTEFLLRSPEPLPSQLIAPYLHVVQRRAAGDPVAYLVGEREFMGLSFAVGPGVLVPRPETELLVEWAICWLNDHPGAVVVDVGAGSGAIAWSIAALAPTPVRAILAVEPFRDAVCWTARNRSRHAGAATTGLIRGDLVSPIARPVDLLLANLPYLRPEQRAENRWLAAEPDTALVGGDDDGLGLIRRLIGDAPRILRPGGAIALEIDPGQADAVADLLRAAWPRAAVSLVPDLAGWPRFALAETIHDDAGHR